METVITEYGFFDSRVKFPSLSQSEERRVEEYELELFTKNGASQTFLNQTGYNLKSGTAICARPGDTRHSKLPFQCYYFHFRTEDPVLLQAIEKIPPHLMLTDPEGMKSDFSESIRLDPAARPEDALLLKALLYRIVYRLAAESRTPASPKKSAAYHYRKALTETEKYIKTHLAEKLELKELAERVNLSPVYFHKLFCSFFGLTPGAFILNARVESAKASLAAGEKDLAEIARECGFSTQSYFTTKFREATGVTPMTYRRNCLSRLEP